MVGRKPRSWYEPFSSKSKSRFRLAHWSSSLLMGLGGPGHFTNASTEQDQLNAAGQQCSVLHMYILYSFPRLHSASSSDDQAHQERHAIRATIPEKSSPAKCAAAKANVATHLHSPGLKVADPIGMQNSLAMATGGCGRLSSWLTLSRSAACREAPGPGSVPGANLVPITVEVAQNTLQPHSSLDDEKQAIKTYRVDSRNEPPAYDSTSSSTANIIAPRATSAEQDQCQLLFTQLPIIARHANNPTIALDIANLSQAIADIRAKRWCGRRKAKRARRQLLRDLWTVEEMKYGTCWKMSCDEKKTVHREMKLVRETTKEEIKRAWWGRDGLYVGTQ